MRITGGGGGGGGEGVIKIQNMKENKLYCFLGVIGVLKLNKGVPKFQQRKTSLQRRHNVGTAY